MNQPSKRRLFHLVLDTNCFIDAVHFNSLAHVSVLSLLSAAKLSHICISVSLHSIHELEVAHPKYDDGALEIARSLPVLPYFPIGTIKEGLGTIKNMAGTTGDAKANDALEKRLSRLAKSGNNLRDRGALIDVARAGADAFVTSDGQLSKNGPAQRILDAIGVQILTPAIAANAFLGQLRQ